jgi:hypothetical protein
MWLWTGASQGHLPAGTARGHDGPDKSRIAFEPVVPGGGDGTQYQAAAAVLAEVYGTGDGGEDGQLRAAQAKPGRSGFGVDSAPITSGASSKLGWPMAMGWQPIDR